MTDTNVAIIGAGPYGLAAAAHLRRAGVEVRIFGEPMSFWQNNMPAGLLLRSNWTATCIAEHEGELSLDSFCAATGAASARRYRWIGSSTTASGYSAKSRRTLTAAWWKRWRQAQADSASPSLTGPRSAPAGCSSRPASRCSPTARPSPPGCPPNWLRTRATTAISSASAERGCWWWAAGRAPWSAPPCCTRAAPRPKWPSGRIASSGCTAESTSASSARTPALVYAPTDVGPMGLSRLVAVPDLFRRLPREAQTPLAYRAIRPAGAALAAATAEGGTDQAGPYRGLRHPAGRGGARHFR